MSVREEIINITVDTKQGIVSINGVTTELKKAKAAFAEATAAIGQNTAAANENSAATGQNTASINQNSASKQANATATKRTEAELQKLIATAIKNRATTATNTAEYDKQSAAINELQVEMAELTSRGKSITAANNTMSSSAGLAGAATMELGRVISDANYGIRGMANNVSQLASLLVALVVNSGGAVKAFGAMVKQFMGPLGLLVVIQIAITAIEALDKRFDFLGTKVDESAKSLEEFNKKLSGKLGTVELLKAFAVILQDSTADIEDQEYALQQLKKSGYDPAIGSMEDFIEAQIKLATVSALSDQFKEEVTKIQALKKDLDKEVEEANTKVAELLKKDPKDVVKRIVVPTGPGSSPATLDITAEMALESAREEVRKTSLKRENNYFNAIEERQKEYVKNISALIDDNPFLDSIIGGKGDKQRKDVEAIGEDLIESRKNINKELLAVFIEGLEEQAQEGLERELRELDVQFGFKQKKLEIRLNAEKQKEEIQKRSIVAEMKYQQVMFALKAAELAMDINMAIQKANLAVTEAQTSIVASSAEAGVELSAGASKAASSAPPPFNIPSILLYAAQAAVIVGGIIKAKREAKAALASVGKVGNLGPDPSAGGTSPRFNVVGASQLSNLSETIATSEQANEPIRAYVVLDDLDTASADKNAPKSDSSF